MAGFGVRVFMIGTPPLWRDEAFTAVAVRNPVPQLLDIVRHDSAPPLAYLLVKVANTISSSEGSLRMASVLAGTAMVPIAAALGRRAAGDRAGIFAGAAMALMPAFVEQARDLRMYALAACFVLASALALWRAIESPTWRRCLVYMLCVALAAYSHYFAVLAVGGQLVAANIWLRPPPRVLVRVGLSAAAGLALLVPWLIAASPQFQHAGSPFWVGPFDSGRAEDLFQQFSAGGSAPSGFPLADTLNLMRVIASAAAAVGALAAVALVLRAGPARRRRVLFITTSALVPVGVLLVISLQRPLFDARYAAVMWAPLVPAIGAGLAWLSEQQRPIGAVLAAATLVPLGAYAAVQGPNAPNDDIRPVVASNLQPADFVAVDGVLQYFTVVYYSPPSAQSQIHVIAPGVRWFDGTAQYHADTWMTAVPPSVAGKVYVISDERSGFLPFPPGFVLRDVQCQKGFCLQTWSR